MGVIRTLGRTGDEETPWTDSKKSQLAAKEVFLNNRANGLIAFATRGEKPAVLIREFDPNEKEIIFTRRLQGG